MEGDFSFLIGGNLFQKGLSRVLSRPHYRPLLSVLASEVKSEKKSVSSFDPLILFNLRYIKGGVRGNNNIGIKKCTTNFLWVLNFGQVGGRRENFQNHTATMIFSKMVSNLSILRLKFGEI